MRINKYLADAGVASRREADRLIEAGRVTLNGRKPQPGVAGAHQARIGDGSRLSVEQAPAA